MKKIIIIALILIAGGFYLYSQDAVEVEDVELGDPEEMKEISSSISDFSFDIFLNLAKDDQNLFISPYSIHTALSMAYIGSDSETAEELRKVLSLTDMEIEKIKSDHLKLMKWLENYPKGNKAKIANAFFLREDIPFLSSYRNDGEKYFNAEISALPETGEPINDWVYEKTKEKIEELIDDGPIGQDVIAYLINAIYFQGNWAEEFDEEKTTERTFYGLDEETKVDMMENESDYLYGETENLKTLTLEYEDGEFLLHVFMPTDGRSPAELLEEMKKEEINLKDITPTEERKIVLRFPKFIMEDKLELLSVLEEMGIEKAFDSSEADFSKMVDLDKLDLNVYISDVVHASFIEVDEKGTEAAAATAVEMELESMPMITEVEFNRPFLFLIEEPRSETILFMGQLINP